MLCKSPMIRSSHCINDTVIAHTSASASIFLCQSPRTRPNGFHFSTSSSLLVSPLCSPPPLQGAGVRSCESPPPPSLPCGGGGGGHALCGFSLAKAFRPCDRVTPQPSSVPLLADLLALHSCQGSFLPSPTLPHTPPIRQKNFFVSTLGAPPLLLLSSFRVPDSRPTPGWGSPPALANRLAFFRAFLAFLAWLLFPFPCSTV